MKLDLSDTRFFVTGVASGIGWATANLLIESGAEVVGADRSKLTQPLKLAAFHRIDLAYFKAKSAIFNVASSAALRWQERLDRFMPLVIWSMSGAPMNPRSVC